MEFLTHRSFIYLNQELWACCGSVGYLSKQKTWGVCWNIKVNYHVPNPAVFRRHVHGRLLHVVFQRYNGAVLQ